MILIQLLSGKSGNVCRPFIGCLTRRLHWVASHPLWPNSCTCHAWHALEAVHCREHFWRHAHRRLTTLTKVGSRNRICCSSDLRTILHWWDRSLSLKSSGERWLKP